MDYPQLLFMRSEIPFRIVFSTLNVIIEDFDLPREIANVDTIVAPYQPGIKFFYDAIDTANLPKSICYYEIIGVSPEMACAPSVEIIDDDDDEDHDLWGPLFEERPSAALKDGMSGVGIIEPPSFGRRMLLLSYENDLDERQLGRLKEQIRRQVHPTAIVWQGRFFEALCFIDNRSPSLILEGLNRILDCNEIKDYLIVQPIKMVQPDGSGLSPLKTWLDGGWKQTLLQPNAHGRRNRRFGQRG